MQQYILALDAGTTNIRAMLVDGQGRIFGHAEKGFTQYFPNEGWVEHDPEEIWQTILSVSLAVMAQYKLTPTQIAAIAITNQRETTFVWDKNTGEVIHKAIVWQDRRSADFCESIREHEAMVQSKTGLRIDPYFSATKIKWILDTVPGAREKAERGELSFGTADSFLLWRLTGGKVHATDATNASRTLLFNIVEQCWDKDLLELFNVPRAMLPQVNDCSFEFGFSEAKWLGREIPILGIAGDQQAALIGQTCFKAGMAKTTYGTGCFMVLNTGEQLVLSKHRLISTVAYRLDGRVCYALEGSIFMAGAIIQWLRDKAKILHSAAESEELAKAVPDNGGVYFVPAFTGLGAPYWDPNARAAILGLTRDSDYRHIVRAALEGVCYQTRDLFSAIEADYKQGLSHMRVDGGMVANNWLCQFLSDILQVKVERPQEVETTVLVAAFLAGLKLGWFQDLEDIASRVQAEAVFLPLANAEHMDALYAKWGSAVKHVL